MKTKIIKTVMSWTKLSSDVAANIILIPLHSID